MTHQVRFRRPRRRDMTPFRAVFIYGLAFLLVAWHQSGRVAEWFENQALENEGRLSETALTLADFLKEEVWPHGPAQINHLEDQLLAWLNLEAEIGAVRPPAPAQPGPDLRGEEEPEAVEEDPELAALPQEPPPWLDPEADPASWLNQVNPDEYLPGTVPEMTEPARPPSPPVPRFNKVLLLGDSMMLEGLGPQLQKELRRRHENLTVDRDGRYGTGLTRLDYFDWLDFFNRMLVKYSPDLVILTIGANDPQDILDPDGPPGRRRIFVGTANWNELYAARVAGLLKLAEDRGVRVFWVGLPIMGREPYGSRVAAINAVASAVCAEAGNCRFWDSWLSVADAKGRFTSYAPDEKGRRLRLRGRDLIHLTEEGGRIMAQKFLAETKDWADYRAAAPPEAEQPAAAQPETEQPAAEQPEAGQTGPARFPAQPPAATQPEAEQPAAEQPGAGQTGTVRFPAEPQGLTIMGVPPLPPRRQGPEAGAPQALPPVITAPPAETGFPVPLEPEEEEDIFVDPLPVDSDSEDPAALRLAPSAGDGETEVFRPGGVSVKPESRPLADWSEGLFYSPALGREVLFRLAQPRPGPGRPGPFPVILLLHGAWDSAEAWERELGREALLALADRLGVILALPEGGPFGWYLDGLETAMETFLLNDFLPEALKKTASDPSRLAVAGLSMGGHGALTLALKRPDLFQAAGALSAVTDLAAHAGSAHAVDPELAVDRVLGPAGPNGRNWRPFGAAGLWETRAGAWAGRPLFLGVGAGDGLTLAENRAFTRQLTRLGIDHVYQEKSGGHDWAYWSAELPGLLEFLALRLKRK